MDTTAGKPNSVTASSDGAQRLGVEDGRALVAAWQASGLSPREFAAKRGVPTQRISYWRLRLGVAQPGDTASAFVQVPSPERPRQAGCVVEWPDGLRLHFGDGVEPDALPAIVAAVRGGAAGSC